MGYVVESWPRRLWHTSCLYIAGRWAQAHLDSLAGKEQTVGNRGTQNHRSPQGDGWVAEAKLEIFRMQHTSLPPVAFPMR